LVVLGLRCQQPHQRPHRTRQLQRHRQPRPPQGACRSPPGASFRLDRRGASPRTWLRPAAPFVAARRLR
jgi:hypothetical protein